MSNIATLPAIHTELESTAASRVSSTDLMLNPESMDKIMRMAEMMANGRSTVPKHLQGSPADCMAVVIQSTQWNMNPFAVAQKTHIVNGTLGYEAQLVNAVVQESRFVSSRFHYEYRGTSPTLECRVGAVIRGESEITWGEWLNESKVTTKNSPLWKTNPKQQLGYLQVKNWARLYCPGAILGVYTTDEIEVPRDMGPVHEVKPELPAGLLAEATKAAQAGVATYQKFWQSTGAANRKLLGDEHENLKSTAIEADKARTVDTPKQAEPATTTDQNSGEVTITFEEVMQRLAKAKNEDALHIACDWASALDDKSRMDEVNAYYDKRLAELRGQ